MEVLLCPEEMEPGLHPEVPVEVVEWEAAGPAPDRAVTASARVAGKRWFTSREHPVIT